MHQSKKKPLSRSERNVLYVLVAFALVISLKTGLFDGYDYRTPELRRSLLSYEEDTAKDEDADVDLEVGAVVGDGPTFVFVMGLEGTGHHFIGSLLENSPNMIKMKELYEGVDGVEMSFFQIMGDVDNVVVLGSTITQVFPALLVLICLFHLFNIWG